MRSLDFLKRVKDINIHMLSEEDLRDIPPTLDNKDKLLQEVTAIAPSGKVFRGFFAFRYLFRYLPHTWLISGIFWLPGVSWVGVRIYRWLALNRYRINTCDFCHRS